MSMTADQRLCKQPAENRKFEMDFTNVLGSSEAITSITSIESEKVGGYTSDLSITNQTIETGDKKVSMFIASGTLGNTYRVEVLVATDASQTLEGDGVLYVTDQ
tara:strand:+ start:516 stop:827 length:312 start_codon:yes stop_codon:yes gene_type:complete